MFKYLLLDQAVPAMWRSLAAARPKANQKRSARHGFPLSIRIVLISVPYGMLEFPLNRLGFGSVRGGTLCAIAF